MDMKTLRFMVPAAAAFAILLASAPAAAQNTLSFDPATVLPGRTTVGTITLATAVANDTTISMPTGMPQWDVSPSNISMPAGTKTAQFTLTIKENTPGPLAIAFKAPGGAAQGTLTVALNQVTSLDLAPATLGAGATATATVGLEAPTYGKSVVVNLSATPAGGVTLPPTATIAAGQRTATFTVARNADASAGVVAVGAARSGGDIKQATLTLSGSTTAPKLGTLVLSPTSVKLGATFTGTVSLSVKAPADTRVYLFAGGAAGRLANFPKSVTISAGQTSVTFGFTVPTNEKTGRRMISASLTPVDESATRAELNVTP